MCVFNWVLPAEYYSKFLGDINYCVRLINCWAINETEIGCLNFPHSKTKSSEDRFMMEVTPIGSDQALLNITIRERGQITQYSYL